MIVRCSSVGKGPDRSPAGNRDRSLATEAKDDRLKVLYLTAAQEDYLQDNMLYGLRMVLGADLVDYPKKEVLYKNYPKPSSELYGRGFTAWRLLDDIDVDRTKIGCRIRNKDFDIIIFGSVRRQKEVVLEYLKAGRFFLPGYRFAFLDGEDNQRILWPIVPLGAYYKRERAGPIRLFTRKISFSIPASKVRTQALEKNQLFAKHVQCDEAYKIDLIRQNCSKSYAFSDELAYYENLARSQYAITMKKAGWDCMRHYEIAANSTVMAFFNLQEKPGCSAPHGLMDMKNVVGFSTADELLAKIDHIEKHNLYEDLQKNATQWAWDNTCERAAMNLLKELSLSTGLRRSLPSCRRSEVGS